MDRIYDKQGDNRSCNNSMDINTSGGFTLLYKTFSTIFLKSWSYRLNESNESNYWLYPGVLSSRAHPLDKFVMSQLTCPLAQVSLCLDNGGQVGRFPGDVRDLLFDAGSNVSGINTQNNFQTRRLPNLPGCLQGKQGNLQVQCLNAGSCGVCQLVAERIPNQLMFCSPSFHNFRSVIVLIWGPTQMNLWYPWRSMLLVLLTIVCGGVPIIENPNSTLLNAQKRFKWLVDLLKAKGWSILSAF